MSCDSNDDDFKLTTEYKYLLSNIRPLIDQLNKTKDAQLCLLWLSKLEQCGKWERQSRNQILSELCEQVKTNNLKPPFSSPPPSGPLRNIFLGEDHSECIAIQKAYHERAQSDQLVIEKYQEVIKSLVSQQCKPEVPSNKLKKLQASYESKISDLNLNLKSKQYENESLKKKIDELNDSLAKLKILQSENEVLKEKVNNLSTVKNTLEEKLKDCEEEKNLIFEDLSSRLNESEKKLKENEKRFKSLERRYEENYNNRESELKAEKTEIEKKYTADIIAIEKLLEEKNSEISVLKEEMLNLNAHFEEEISRIKHDFSDNFNISKNKEKIKLLKSKTRKLEKVRERMAVLFHSQMQQIIAKKDFYIATLEMQLKMFTSDLETNQSGSDVHTKMLEKVSALESQYRELLKESEKQSIKRRQMDLQKIHNLEKRLLLCGGSIDDSYTSLNCSKTKSLTSVTAFERKRYLLIAFNKR
ncbi:conserved hypothetical protein [Pediculus humanus corporis]|uniref:DUF4485 domain-containing protein n=1 Tax=Pediculus humanus subsp. corporis TaxID=121224 RepID=E0VEU9_PEDHC|nr:uncharacterized protein Phum_PHUM140710 [Pediculus humanus corporis]EEB11905.1 conserved hypothetical protein [Pediculus humanus corporis]